MDDLFKQPVENMRFPIKLFHIATNDITGSVWWSEDGQQVVMDIIRFEENYLRTRLFKTDQFGSLVRQLNLYSFVQVGRTIKIRDLAGPEPTAVISELRVYRSPFFKRDEPEMLRAMRRGMNTSGVGHLTPRGTRVPKRSSKMEIEELDLKAGIGKLARHDDLPTILPVFAIYPNQDLDHTPHSSRTASPAPTAASRRKSATPMHIPQSALLGANVSPLKTQLALTAVNGS